jgi:biopolymer transport protein ExbB
LVEQGGARDNAQEAQRIHELERDQDNQQRLLNEALAEKSREEARRDRLETTFEENELLIAGVTEQILTPRPTTPILE